MLKGETIQMAVGIYQHGLLLFRKEAEKEIRHKAVYQRGDPGNKVPNYMV